MSKIKTYVLNFHGMVSHIEIVLENTSTIPYEYYHINSWAYPETKWSKNGPKKYIDRANSVYSFYIDADPDEITSRWRKYCSETYEEASILGKNCAVAAQWFLTEFAGIPKPNLSNVSWNHLALGIIWPSFIPCPVTLPGRVISNTIFHVEAKTHPENLNIYSCLFICTTIALATLVYVTSVFAMNIANKIPIATFAALTIASISNAGVASTYGLFKGHNTLSAKNISDEMKKTDELLPIVEEESLTPSMS